MTPSTTDVPPLPTPRTRLVGREQEVRTVLDAVDASTQAVVTITGIGGSGKTTLATEILRHLTVQFARRWFVDLTRLDRAEDLAGHVCHRLGVRRGTTGPLAVLEEELGRAPALLVLDNCEHLLDAVAELVGSLSATCPELTVLATSRRPLDVPAERTVALGPLPVTGPDGGPGAAVELLVERARTAGADLSADDVAPDGPTAAHLAAVCRRLDGLPLPIVLAATHLRTMHPAELAERVERDLTLPAMRGGADHQRTMAASIDWSLDLLATSHRDLLLRAGVFVGAFDADDCRAVCRPDGTPEEVDDGLRELVEHSLLTADTSAAPTRYRMLAVVREHARRRLGAGPTDRLAVAHRVHLTTTIGVTPSSSPFYTPADVARLEVVHDDAVAALDRAVRDEDAAAVVGLLMALMRFWRVTGRIRFGLDHAARASVGLDGFGLAVVHLVRADLERLLGLLDDADEHVRAGLAIVRAGGAATAHALPTGLGIRGDLLSARGRHDDALALYDEIRALYDPVDRPQLHGVWCANVGGILLAAGRDAEAEPRLLEARRVLGGQPPVWLAGRVHGHLGTLARRAGDLDAARELVLAGLDELAPFGALAEAAPLVDELAAVLRADGRPRDAEECARAAASMRRRVGSTSARHDGPGEHGPDVADVTALVRDVRTAPAPADALTAREREVADLVAEGLTNPQIARRLVISPGTARTHVERIRTKLGVSSRVHVARWVLERYVDRRTR
ncbi:LuxR C-terminal-related transcriptional regulator [Isoptericola sp. AK164]|uniref:ATP-binding protein n=1 Tax=Isoptericola sp. AK164 TaxID=3024246 RepID=UPI0024188692|nr:LuxR C-terminal-related transcriptional regulator [Isoptericola sp. AK164]